MHITAESTTWAHALKPFLTFLGTLEDSSKDPGAITFQGERDSVTITAISHTLHLQQTLPAKINKPGSSIIPFIPFYQFLKTLSAGAFTLTTKGANCTITSKEQTNCELKLKMISSENIPPFSPSRTPEVTWTIPSAPLIDSLPSLLPYVEKHHTRPALQGFLFHLTASSKPLLSIIGTDGHRLAKYDLPLETLENPHDSPMKYIISKHTIHILIDMGRHLPASESWLMTATKNQVTFTFGCASLTNTLIEGQYVNYRAIIPSTSTFTVRRSSTSFHEAVRRMNTVNNTVDHPIRITADDRRMTLTTKDHMIGDGLDSIDVHSSSLNNSIEFNTKFLLDLLKAFDQEMITWKRNSSDSPSCFTGDNHPDLLFIVMPTVTKT